MKDRIFTTRWVTPENFRTQALSFLARNEAENSALIAILFRVEAGRTVPAEFFIVAEDSDVVMAGVMRAEELILSGGPHEALDVIAEDLARAQRRLVSLNAPFSLAEPFAHLWSAKTGTKWGSATNLTIYVLSQLAPSRQVPGHARKAVAQDQQLLVKWITDFWDQHLVTSIDVPTLVAQTIADEEAWLWIDPSGNPVSTAWQAGVTPSGVRVGPVYTPSESRGHGYAQAVTGHLCAHLLAAGHQFCFLLADREDPSANRLYGNLGFRPVGARRMERALLK